MNQPILYKGAQKHELFLSSPLASMGQSSALRNPQLSASRKNLVKKPRLASIDDVVKAVVSRSLSNGLHTLLHSFGVDAASLAVESYTHKILASHDIASPLLDSAGVKLTF